MTKQTKKQTAVVVTTEHRGVFFGYVEDDTALPDKITLTDARMCVYWSEQVKGVLGLAATGPNDKCRIGTKVPRFTAWKITSVSECTPEAIEAWEQAPWSS